MSDSTAQTDWTERVKAYIDENVGDIEKANEMAGIVDVSYDTLRRRFRRAERVPVGAYTSPSESRTSKPSTTLLKNTDFM